MILGLAAAVAAALAYGFASILQAAAMAGSSSNERIEVMVLARLVAQWRYVAGLGLDLVGFAAAVVALRTLPLFVVQAAVASSVGVTALAASRLLHARISHGERRALLGLGIGLLLLAVAGRPEHATELTEPGPFLLLAAAPVVAVVSWACVRSSSVHAGAVLAAGAGITFGAVGVAARGFDVPSQWVHVLGDPLLYAIAANGVLATFLFAAALQRGDVTTVAAITFGVETIAPAAIGVAWLGDRARPGMAPVAAIGFAITIVTCVALARFAEPARLTPEPSDST